MIEVFATDLDGTLLNAFHLTDKRILAALKQVVDAGAHVVIATGRTMRSTNEHGFEGLPLDIVELNGAIVRDATGKVVKSFPLDKAALEKLLRAFPDVVFECVSAEGTYITATREKRQAQFARDGFIRRIAMRGMCKREESDPTMHFEQSVEQVLEHDIVKINSRVVDEQLKRDLAAYLDAQDTFVNMPFKPIMFEITNADVNKGASISWLAQSLGFTDNEVAVYGDGGNDVTMLERFEHAYATANADADAKKAAGNVIGNCAFHAVPRHMLATVRAERGRVTIA